MRKYWLGSSKPWAASHSVLKTQQHKDTLVQVSGHSLFHGLAVYSVVQEKAKFLHRGKPLDLNELLLHHHKLPYDYSRGKEN